LAGQAFRIAVRRLSHDDEAVALLMKLHSDTSSPHLRASVPRLLAAARGITPELRRRFDDELDREFVTAESPVVGYDLAADDIRAVAISLCDVLANR
jgi:hypothetical protein